MVIFLVVLVVAALVAQRWTLRHGLDRVSYSLTPEQSVVDPGEWFTVTTCIGNHKRMPVSYLRVQENLPAGISFESEEGLDVQRGAEDTRITSSMYLGGRKTSRRQLQVSLPDRGRYFFLGCTLYGGDFLGFNQDVRYLNRSSEVVVCPARCENPEVQKVLGGFLGDISVRRYILEDPILTVGFREYTGREPFRAISWAQSARAGQLMVKQYDYTAEPSATVILNVEYRGDLTRDMAGRIEECYRIARTVCEGLEEKGIRYDFLTNATAAGALGVWSTVEEGLGSRHLGTVLEGLGRADYSRTATFDRLIARSMRRTDAGRGRIIITPDMLPGYQQAIDRLTALRGGQVQVLMPNMGTAEEESA